jgi:hypothetical protein
MRLVVAFAVTCLGCFGYTLTVEFSTGHTYDHPGAPYSVYEGLMQAASKGAFYNRYVRGRYR